MKKITDYAELVKAKHALNKTIAPVEDGANMAGSYTTGQQFIRDGVLYTALTSIAASTAFSSLTLDTDYEVADDITSQLSSVNSALSNKLEVTTITNISQIPNSDLKSLPTGMYLIQGSVMNNSNLIDAPFVADSAIGLTILTHPDGYILYEAVPLNFEAYPIYTGRYYSAISPHIQWGTQIKTSNRNLIDNPWFTVNQRGFSTSVTGSKYGYDRWKGVYSYSANGVSMSASDYMIQDVETEFKNMGDGKMMTASILLSDGRMFTGSAVYHKDDTTQYITSASTGGVLSCSSGSFDNYAFSITASASITIRAVKLELGSVSTLAMDTAPNYAEELLKCQRYFYRAKGTGSYGVITGTGYVNSATDIRILVSLPTTMRANPAITKSENLVIMDMLGVSDISSNFSIDNTFNSFCGNFGWMRITGSNFGTNKMAAIRVNNDNTAHIDFSADL